MPGTATQARPTEAKPEQADLKELREKVGVDLATATRSTRNLFQRLNAVQGEVDHIKATGKTAYNQKALSIEDVEDALGDLFAKHGVVTGYHFNSKPEVAGNEGRSTLWLVDLTIWLRNADAPTDLQEDALFDVGTSPSAAVSFALKRYYKAMFHLADEEDETRSMGVSRAVAPAGNGEAPAAPRGSKLTEPEVAKLTALNASLPTPKPAIAFQAILRDLPYDKGLSQLTMAHDAQCGQLCSHVTGVKA